MSLIQTFGPIRQHGYLVKDLDTAIDFWLEKLGVGPWFGYRNVMLRSEFENQSNDIRLDVGLAYQNGVQIELIHQTDDTPSPYRFFYDTEDNLMQQQLAFFCKDIAQAKTQAINLGLKPAGKMVTPTGSQALYFSHPTLGKTVVELLEVDQTLLDGFAYFEQQTINWDGKDDPIRIIDML
ncbi:MAG: hypothetical protein CL693_14005 [Cellvibrionaceae bacterium]|nr:hypothetical protein [Cellvibrionaceae bacterium]|tara:strand:- start:20370 stop:20909 length:540 start_codon:yes stop_codon:yes gene_type:complete